MQIVLLNFSDASRSLVDRRNRTITVAVGEMKKADIHEPHYRMLKHGTFLALPEEVEIPERTVAAVQLMGRVDTTPYDELLNQFWGLAGRDANKLRPTRAVIRLALRDIAQNALADIGVGKHVAQRVTINEQGDENTRRDPDEGSPPVKEPDTDNPPPVKEANAKTKVNQPRGHRPRVTVRTRARA